MKKTTSLYILNEISPIFFISLMTFTIILLMDKIFKLVELIVTRGVNPVQILKLLLFISPSFLIFTIPISVLVGTLLTFGRMSADSEITAFKASGISLYQLFLPIALFSIGAYLVTSLLVLYGLPWGNRGFKSTLFAILQTKASIEIKERVFNDAFDGLVVYVDRVPIQGEKIEGILIYDERDKASVNTIFAREGFVINNPQSKDIILRLLKGDIHRYDPKTNVYQKIEFDAYDLRLELAKALTVMWRKLKDWEMSIDDIKEKIEFIGKRGGDTTSLKVEIHRRYAFPFACIIFALIGVPLGVQPQRSGRSHGFVLSILILVAYYISLSASEVMALRKEIPPFLGGWMPNFLFGGFGLYLLIKTAKESPFKPLIWLNDGLNAIQRKWRDLVDYV
ncbi:MAG: LPS export ABC transporter permease LptF [Deltaproteobacteria bacterium RBG_16_50_11]|nr:MAG: LPS export ABC transporter permease LptF [Deltaproteobacteria bacterium RBG_16_50_11]